MIIKDENFKVLVPAGIRYLSDWPEFCFRMFPAKGIVNKQIPGCGFTEYCIRGPENMILCSPRKMLLNNKYGQHLGEVYLVINELDKDPQVDKDLSKLDRSQSYSMAAQFIKKLEDVVDPETRKRDIYNRLHREIREYLMIRDSQGLPYKILVTYDSYRIVQDILIDLGIFQDFYTIVDEFQSILHDARFKSDTELEFMGYLKKSHSALLVSATPLLEEYLDMLSEFDGLPYFELDWATLEPGRIIKPSLKVLTMKSVGTKAQEVIQSYLDGNFEKAVRIIDGQPMEIVSDEAVLFVNSVNHIISIIKKMKLTPEQTNILCADTPENQKKIHKKLGKRWTIGTVPKKTEKPKMFTLCTSTVYLGADFYSRCARSFIFSDSNLESLAVDISDDLPQILGRQRLEENPWSNSATFYYRTTCDYRKTPESEFNALIEKKKKATSNLLSIYQKGTYDEKQSLATKFQSGAKSDNYKTDYVAVNSHAGVGLVPVVNNLVLVNELRVFRIQQLDYLDRFSVFSSIRDKIIPDNVVMGEVSQFFEEYDNIPLFRDKLKFLCEYGLSDVALKIVLDQVGDHDNIKSFYLALGPVRLRALSYNKHYIRRELGIVVFDRDLLDETVLSNFKIGERVSNLDAKEKLQNLYTSISYKVTPKAKDLENYFIAKSCKVLTNDGFRLNGLEIIDIKDEYKELYKKIQEKLESLDLNNNYDILD